MPQRFLKPGIVSSKKWDGLSWIAQSFYIRVVTLVDDFGRYLADSVLLKNQCFPLREDIRASQVLDLCQDLDRAQLAIFYKVDGKEFLQLTNWTERKRSNASHYPPHTNPQAVLMFPLPSAANRSEPQPPKSKSESSSKPESKPSPYAAVSKRIDDDYQREQGKRLHGIPASVEEVIEYGRNLNPPVSEDRCRAFWAHYEGQSKTNPNGDTFWVTSGQGGEIVVTKWTVKLPQFGIQQHANSRTSSQQRPNRNTGTANEGNESKYERLGKVVKG